MGGVILCWSGVLYADVDVDIDIDPGMDDGMDAWYSLS